MSSFRTLPTRNPGVSRMEFDYYHSGSEEEFVAYYKSVPFHLPSLLSCHLVFSHNSITPSSTSRNLRTSRIRIDSFCYRFVRQVALEDFELCEKAQQNLERGVYGEGILNPNKENGVVFYQRRVRECVYRQFEEEKRAQEKEKNGLVVGKSGVVEGEGKVIEVV